MGGSVYVGLFVSAQAEGGTPERGAPVGPSSLHG
jgi:hypothetical protein